jgi:hypothetical protein
MVEQDPAADARVAHVRVADALAAGLAADGLAADGLAADGLAAAVADPLRNPRMMAKSRASRFKA